jgi:hypothetical protein
MGITHWLEKFARDGWKIEIMPYTKGDYPFRVEAVNGEKRFDACDEYSPANAIKMLAEKIYDENAG